LRTPQECSDDMPMGQNPTNPGLKTLQALLYRLITAPEGVAAGLAAERAANPKVLDHSDHLPLDHLIESDDRLSATERLEIYANAYFYRILDCLKEDFPATLATLGPGDFHNLITAYLIEYPPTEPSISDASRHLAEFLRHPAMRAMLERWPFVAELARLERTLNEIFLAAEAEPLNAETMRSVAPEDWPTLAMRTHPALAIVDCEWRVDQLLREVQAGAHAGGRPPGAPAHARVSVLVWRQNSRVHYRALERPERAALGIASAGASFAMICETVDAACGQDQFGSHGQPGSIAPVALINRLLALWVADGLLVLADK
jgi:Putative DNA-binding domain